jgi:hypothetical protein
LFLESPETDLASKSAGDRTPVKDDGGWPTAEREATKRDGDDRHRSERERERERATVSDGGDQTPVKRRREGEDQRARGSNGTFVRKLERERERAALEGK